MTIKELETKVWEQDGIRIIVRDRSWITVNKYQQTNAAQENWSVTQFLNNRISPLVKEREVVVLDGAGKMPHGRKLLKTIRDSYN